MKLSRIKDILQAEILWGEELLDIEVNNACGADLISDILADTKTNAILLTGLTHRQIIQTASMSDFAAIVFVRGKVPAGDVIELAKQQRLPLLSTRYPLYETCGILYREGLRGEPAKFSCSSGALPRQQEALQVMKLNYEITGNDFNNAGKATEQAKKILKQIGVDSAVIRKVSIAAYEAEMNIVIHAEKGNLSFNITPKYIEVVADDTGPGIADIDKAMQEGFSTAPDRIRELGFGAGMGLPNMKKFSDIFEISSVIGIGTTVRMIINL
ncbi:MAG: serine/threonine-protein kinase RsbT [Thermoanaerobacteraceae bacterium]|jgi:anti-sigma regulatory factor (Ser/Thr protein kinase)|nr:serine/threonine-protein kinase RsbT [Thermoanaerobacteraceae bacterium]